MQQHHLADASVGQSRLVEQQFLFLQLLFLRGRWRRQERNIFSSVSDAIGGIENGQRVNGIPNDDIELIVCLVPE